MTTIISYLLLRPNWGSGMTYFREWKTTIQESVTGEEKRSALYTWPRKGLDYDLLFKEATEKNYYLRKMYLHLDDIWGVPIWPDITVLTVAGAITDVILNVDSTQYKHFENDGLAIIINIGDPNDYEVVEISSFTNTQITIKVALTKNWTIAQAEIYPVLAARLEPSQKARAHTDAIGTTKISAREAFTAVTSTTTSTTTTS